jgi:hypothetical protein
MNLIESNCIYNKLKQPNKFKGISLSDPSDDQLAMEDDESPQMREFWKYEETIIGWDQEDDKHKSVCDEPYDKYDGKEVCKGFLSHLHTATMFHVEIEFKDFHFTDTERLAMVQDFVDDINIEVLTTHRDIRLQRIECDYGPEELDGEPMTKEDVIRDAFIIRSQAWNEFRRPDKHPRLHVLISISPPYFARLQMEIFERLRSLEIMHNCKFKQVTVKRITNRAQLLCKILGVHKDRFYRELSFY